MIKNKRSFTQAFIVGLFFLLSSVTFSFANVPAPPVNQNIGIPDTTFANLTKLNCAYCHAPEKLTDAQKAEMGWTFDRPQMKPGILADRHHARVDTIMKDGTQAPFGTAGDPYTCLSCHKIAWSEDSMTYELSDNFKDCQNCHISQENVTVHHLTTYAQSLNCKHCHGARIDNPNDGHYIPLGRTPTMVTPRTSGGKGAGGQGACTFCHNAGTESASGIAVNTNAVNHHSTGIGQVGISDLDCTLCHDRAGSDWAIRRCQNCHGIDSLHNIQADSNGDGVIIVGQELPYFGHIGNDPLDCKGCHGGSMQRAVAVPKAGPIIPQINDLSTFKILAGKETTLTVSGLALTNEINGRLLKSTITIARGDDVVAELTPSSISQSSLTVTIPASLSAGNYYIRAKKGPKDSNPMNIVVVPNVVISGISINNSALTVQGSGFGAYLNSVNSNTRVLIAGTQCSIESWTSSQIVAKCPSQCGEVVVNSIFGNSTYAVECDGNGGGDGNNDNYQAGYNAAYDAAFAEGNGDRCSGKTWNIDADLKYDTKYNQGYTDGYVYAYDVGWESDCNDGGNDGSSYEDGYKAAYDAAFAEGNGDKCSGKIWNIDANLNYDTKYNQGYTDGYVKAYDTGWESSCGNGGGNDNDGSYEDGVSAAQEAGFAEGKSDSCGNKTWNIGVELTYDTPYNDGYAFGYVKAYDEGWESCR